MKCDMCDTEATADVVTIRDVMRLCDTCLEGQRQAGIIEGEHDVGWLSGMKGYE